jgi:hypothetical protein
MFLKQFVPERSQPQAVSRRAFPPRHFQSDREKYSSILAHALLQKEATTTGPSSTSIFLSSGPGRATTAGALPHYQESNRYFSHKGLLDEKAEKRFSEAVVWLIFAPHA